MLGAGTSGASNSVPPLAESPKSCAAFLLTLQPEIYWNLLIVSSEDTLKAETSKLKTVF